MCFNYLHTLLGKIFKYFAHLIIVFLCFILGCKSFIYIFKVQIWKRRCTYYWQAIFASIKMKILHIDAFLHSFLNCLLKSRHSLCHVWRGNSRDCLSPQGFQDGKEIYIYIYLATECYGGYCEHVIFALNSGGLSREKNVST